MLLTSEGGPVPGQTQPAETAQEDETRRYPMQGTVGIGYDLETECLEQRHGGAHAFGKRAGHLDHCGEARNAQEAAQTNQR